MKLEINLNKIKKLSEKNDRENWIFRSFLKGYDATIEEMDAIVHELYQKISSEIDCTICANCCKEVQPLLDLEDIKKCCEGLKVSASQFKKKYLKSDKEEGNFIFKEKPCPFLKTICVQFIPTVQRIVNHFPICIRKNLFSDYGVSWRIALFARLSLMSMNSSKVNSGIRTMMSLQMTRRIFFINT
jgi:hypothetical protein